MPPAASAAATGQADLDAAKDHLAALEKAAAQGLEVSAADFNTAVTEVDLKTRRQAFLNKAHTAENVTYAVALFDVAARMKADAKAQVDAIQTILDRATHLAAGIEATTTRESYGATTTLNLPVVEDIGDLDGVLGWKDNNGKLEARPANRGGFLYRLNGRVFDSKGELGGNFERPNNG